MERGNRLKSYTRIEATPTWPMDLIQAELPKYGSRQILTSSDASCARRNVIAMISSECGTEPT